MDVFFNHYVYGSVMVKHLIEAIVIIGLIMWLFPKIFSKKERPDVYETVRCLECGWAGQVSKYHRTCRKCNSTTLDKIG